MALKIPSSIKNDKWKAAKWREITKGRSFSAQDTPTLTMLVQWYAVLERCISDISEADGDVAYENKLGDLKAMPQINVMKQASAEIRALNKQLGIADGRDVDPGHNATKKSSTLTLITNRRKERKHATI